MITYLRFMAKAKLILLTYREFSSCTPTAIPQGCGRRKRGWLINFIFFSRGTRLGTTSLYVSKPLSYVLLGNRSETLKL
jgi:hypothetical protein